MKRTIEDLTESKTFYHRSRDAFGNRIKEPYQKDIKRPVKVVTGWTRFAHYLIDALIILAISVAVDFLLGGFSQPNIVRPNGTGIFLSLIPNISSILITSGYYFLCEHYMQRTIGKFATDSVVINQYAEPVETGILIGRSFARMIPFEAFSCLSDRGWHDTLTKTYVVTTAERDKLKRLLAEQDGIFISDSPDLLD